MLKEFSAEEAVQELERRRNDEALIHRVCGFIGEVPEGLPDQPFAALCRQVATARREDFAFEQLAGSMGLMPFWPTYLSDVFTSKNPDKTALCKLPIEDSRQQSGYTRRRIANIGEFDGRVTMREVPTQCTFEGMPLRLPELHQHVRSHVLNGTAKNTADFSTWLLGQAARQGVFPGNGNVAKCYYPQYLSLFVVHGVLIEDFSGGPNDSAGLHRFVRDVVKPAATRVADETGCLPLYVKLPWQAGYELYPRTVLDLVNSLMA